MSKTLSLSKPVAPDASPPAPIAAETLVKSFTSEQLRDMLRAAQISEGVIPVDPTMDLSIDSLPLHVIADRSALPPADARASAPAQQLPGKAHGSFALNGIAVMAPQLGDAAVNPADGRFYTQIGPRPATQISPPPSRRFDGR